MNAAEMKMLIAVNVIHCRMLVMPLLLLLLSSPLSLLLLLLLLLSCCCCSCVLACGKAVCGVLCMWVRLVEHVRSCLCA